MYPYVKEIIEFKTQWLFKYGYCPVRSGCSV